jgi:hypothetical protein
VVLLLEHSGDFPRLWEASCLRVRENQRLINTDIKYASTLGNERGIDPGNFLQFLRQTGGYCLVVSVRAVKNLDAIDFQGNLR